MAENEKPLTLYTSPLTKEQAEKFAKRMSLATSADVRDLKRTVRSLEDEVAELKRDSGL